MAQQHTALKEKRNSFPGLTPLMAPVPPMLEKAIDYTGEARFVSFHWTPYGDEADYDDGQRAGTGNWQGFLAFIQHPTVSPLLTQYDLGSSDTEAQHSLILDRHERKLYVASINDAQTFLAQQWPKAEAVYMSQEEYLALITKALKNVKQNDTIDMDEIHRRIGEEYAVIDALQHWLNQFLPN